MSWQALNWANEQQTSSTSAQFVLILLANVADVDGFVRFVSADNLAKWSRQSRASVFRRLKDLEEVGLLVREPAQFSRSGGRLVSGQLRLDRTYIAASTEAEPSGGSSQVETTSDEGRSSQVETTQAPERGGSLTGETEVVSLVTRPHIDSNLNLNSNLPTTTLESATAGRRDNDQPSAAAATKGLGEGSAPHSGRADLWTAFLGSYPSTASMDVARAKSAFSDLTLKDAAKAVRWAKLYADDLAARGRTQPFEMWRWLVARRFDEIAEAQAAKAPKGEARVFVRRGTPAWEAWSRERRGKIPVQREPGGTADGWWFPSLFPHGLDPGAGFDATAPPEMAESF